jgi:hypothetical protein
MPPRKLPKANKQPMITTVARPLIKPAQHIGKQIAVPGSFWEGRMDVHEKETKYMCTIREYKAAYKWGSASNSPVTQAIELQEMGPEGRGSLEQGDASGEIFHMVYPEPFLQYFYDTFPEQMPMPVGAIKPLSPPGVAGAAACEAVDEDLEETKPDVIAEFPHVRLGRAAIYQHWAIISDTLIEAGPKSGQYCCKMQCIIEKSDGSVCGEHKEITHRVNKGFSTTNFIRHLRDEAEKGCVAHNSRARALPEPCSEQGDQAGTGGGWCASPKGVRSCADGDNTMGQPVFAARAQLPPPPSNRPNCGEVQA